MEPNYRRANTFVIFECYVNHSSEANTSEAVIWMVMGGRRVIHYLSVSKAWFELKWESEYRTRHDECSENFLRRIWRCFQWFCFPATRRSIALTRRWSWYLAQLRQLKCILLCSARSIELYCNVIFNVLFFFLRLCWCRLEKLFTMLRERAKAGPKRKITNVDVQEPGSMAQGRIPLQSHPNKGGYVFGADENGSWSERELSDCRVFIWIFYPHEKQRQFIIVSIILLFPFTLTKANGSQSLLFSSLFDKSSSKREEAFHTSSHHTDCFKFKAWCLLYHPIWKTSVLPSPLDCRLPPRGDAWHREFVYFDARMIWLTDRLLIVSQAGGASSLQFTSLSSGVWGVVDWIIRFCQHHQHQRL